MSDSSMRTTQVIKGEMSAKTTYQRSAKGPVSISECSADGTYVALENTGRKVHKHHRCSSSCAFMFSCNECSAPTHSERLHEHAALCRLKSCQSLNKKFDRGTARCPVSVETVPNDAKNVRRIVLEKPYNSRMTFEVIKGHWIWHESIDHMTLPVSGV